MAEMRVESAIALQTDSDCKATASSSVRRSLECSAMNALSFFLNDEISREQVHEFGTVSRHVPPLEHGLDEIQCLHPRTRHFKIRRFGQTVEEIQCRQPSPANDVALAESPRGIPRADVAQSDYQSKQGIQLELRSAHPDHYPTRPHERSRMRKDLPEHGSAVPAYQGSRCSLQACRALRTGCARQLNIGSLTNGWWHHQS